MRFGSKTYGGSGSLVGPHHLLTCAHNVYDTEKKCWANKIVAHPGRNESSAPFGEATVTKAYIFEEWQKTGSKEADIALLLLEHSIGKFTGWGSVHCSSDDSFVNEEFNITGYPGDKGCKQMWSMCHRLKRIHAQTFEYEIDTEHGQSGSAIWSNKLGQPTIIGVHTLGSNDMNFGVRITEEIFRCFIIGIVKETYKLRDLNKLLPIKHLSIEPAVLKSDDDDGESDDYDSDSEVDIIVCPSSKGKRKRKGRHRVCALYRALKKFESEDGKLTFIPGDIIEVLQDIEGQSYGFNRSKWIITRKKSDMTPRWFPSGFIQPNSVAGGPTFACNCVSNKKGVSLCASEKCGCKKRAQKCNSFCKCYAKGACFNL